MNAGRSTIAVLGAAFLLNPSPAAADPDVPPPGSVSVEVAALYGSGCLPGRVWLGSNVESFTVHYAEYIVTAGRDQTPRDSHKNCWVDVKVSHPPEFTYGIIKVEHRGSGELEDGASASMRSSFAFLGEDLPEGAKHLARGPYRGSWQLSDKSDISEVRIKPCDKPSTNRLFTELKADEGASDPSTVSYMALDDIDRNPGSSYHFHWERC
ncbi:DUF4360 domain-containing protein [Actinomadura graeca]|uniref:DUF4360 domain-containing protein n=1 Tax=Actinomadura graeca TaxID=2750812 RepID=A0ABX8QS89_9ACTN|nr:DUF4360 domain-containing protein [Actinomadura graeca]QXJ21570.1 DUF4360 domain-containing protein [Actinomadura graeca]